MTGKKRLGGWTTFWLIQCFGWGFYGLVRFTNAFLFGGFPFHWIKLVFLAGGIAIGLLLFVAYRRMWRQVPSVPWRLAGGVTGSLCAGAAWFALCEVLIVRRGWTDLVAGLPEQWPSYLALYGNLTTVFVSWTAIHFGWLFWRDVQRVREQALQSEAAARRAELEMLRYQLNPHFLFNALNSLRALIAEDPRRARDMVDELSAFLRSTLMQSSGDSVPLEREIEFVRAYLQIEQVRFEEKLAFEIEVDPRLTDVSVPGLLLQPLVENAVKHGRATSPLPLCIRLDVRRKEGQLEVDVMNTGRLNPGPGSLPGTGTGLANVRGRLQELYPGRHELRLDGGDHDVHAILRIPLSSQMPENRDGAAS